VHLLIILNVDLPAMHCLARFQAELAPVPTVTSVFCDRHWVTDVQDTGFMKILLTNDDGIYASGLWALYDRLALTNQVTVVAPDRERSAVGHGITLHQPLRSVRVRFNGCSHGVSVNGTPADCVKLGLTEILETRPDLVISGINPGENVGVNINYSGTVAAAREAALYGVAAIAVSIQGRKARHLDAAAIFVERLARYVVKHGLPFGTILNVNVPDLPAAETAGVRISRQGLTRVSEYFEKRVDPRNRTYFWPGMDKQEFENHPDVDGRALGENFISVTPIKCDMTDYDMLKDIRAWNLDF